jgi:hypothetical protein
LREVLGKAQYLFVATYADECFLYNKSLLHIRHKSDSEKHLLALLAVLNSKVGSFLLLMRGAKSQRKLFPKIVLADLKTFLLPAQFELHVEVLAELGKLRSQSRVDEDDSLDEAIDCRVAQIYGLSPEDSEQMNSVFEGRGRRGSHRHREG